VQIPDEEPEMTIKQFAERYNLKTSRDECGDAIIRGRLGHLYVDDGQLCAMWTDARPMSRFRLAALGGRPRQGDKTPVANGKYVQDTWVRGIDPEAYRQAIALVGAKERRVMSPAQRDVLDRARLLIPRPLRQGHFPGLESLGDEGGAV
jgi:hypothetical protein